MNQLANALSPYLQQHRNNPVNWQEWGDKPFEEARQRDVPVLLSIGYAACHWCHVMAHESFEDPQTAALLNDYFVCIKVDKEERPDIDQLYMQALLKMQGHGGWPLNVFLTPDKHPFFAGTYFPKQPRYGMPSFNQLLENLIKNWQYRRDEIAKAEYQVQQAVYQDIGINNSQNPIDIEHIQRQYHTRLTQIDSQYGGIQGAPKFPQIPFWSSWFKIATLFNQSQSIQACYQMARSLSFGGIYDHLGGGFFRYSTDEKWLVPHFEKMLYDNAQIIEWLAQLQAYQAQSFIYQRIKDTINWLDREMLLDNGCYAASLDADSEGVEGKFYTWSWQELQTVLGDDLPAASQFFNLQQQGNWEGVNILYCGTQEASLNNDQLERIKDKLWQKRKLRIRPERDDKILLDWNAMLVNALAQAGIRLNQPQWIHKASHLYSNLYKALFDGQYWQHACRASHVQTQPFLGDYAHITQACITLAAATGDQDYLHQAEHWMEQANNLFGESEGAFYKQAPVQACDLPHNPQPIIDGAEPSGNGIMAINGMQLFLLTGEFSYAEKAQYVIDNLSQALNSEHCYELPSMISAILWQHYGMKIQGPWQQLQHPPQDLLPIQLLQNDNAQQWQACDHQSCWAVADSLQALQAQID